MLPWSLKACVCTISSDITDSPLSLAHRALTGPVVLLVFSAENVGLAKKFVQVFHKILQENPNELLANPIEPGCLLVFYFQCMSAIELLLGKSTLEGQ